MISSPLPRAGSPVAFSRRNAASPDAAFLGAAAPQRCGGAPPFIPPLPPVGPI